MKYLILIFLMSINLYADDDIGININWNCSYAPVDEAIALAANQQINVEIDSDESSISLKPDIFNLIRKETNTTLLINSDSCIKNFLKSFQKVLVANKQKCKSSSCKGEINLLKKHLVTSQYFKLKKELPKISFIHLGHNGLVNSEDLKRIFKNSCNNKNTRDDLIKLLSQKAITQLSSELKNNPTFISNECYKKIKATIQKITLNNLPCKSNNQTCLTTLKKQKNAFEEVVAIQKIYDDKILKDKAAERKRILDNESESLRLNNFLDADAIDSQKVKDAFNMKAPAIKFCNLRDHFSNNNARRSIYDFDDEFAKYIPFMKNNFSKDCIKQIVQNYITYKIRHRSKKTLLCELPECKRTKEKQARFDNNVLSLIDGIYQEKEKKIFCEKLPNIDTTNPGAFVSSLLEDIEQVKECSPYEIGETKVHRQKRNGINSQPNHSVERVSEKEYKANLAINFTSPSQHQTNEMYKKVKACITKMDDYFLSDNGEKISINILTPAENEKLEEEKRLAPVDIEISNDPKFTRSHSKKYEKNVDCPTITHELLHLLGLVDEYKESDSLGARQVICNHKTKNVIRGSNGLAIDPSDSPETTIPEGYIVKTAYVDCRAHATIPSVMATQERVMEKTLKKKSHCLCKSKRCQNIYKDPSKALLASSTPWQYRSSYHQYCKSSNSKYIPFNSSKKITDKPLELKESTKDTLSFTSRQLKDDDGRLTLIRHEWSCKCDNDKCRDFIAEKAKQINNSFYPGYKFCPSVTDDALKDATPVGPDENGIKLTGNTLTIVSPQPNKSLLHKAHFEKIKWGGCSSKVKKYNECAKYAYKYVSFECAERPKYCNDVKEWLLKD